MIYNHVVMRGNLGHVPELRKTSKGQAVTNVSIAVYNGKDADGNAKKEWFTWVIWGKKAEDFCVYASKGDRVTFEGRAGTSTGRTKSGEEYKVTVFVADDYELIPKKPKADAVAYQYGEPYTATPSDEDVPF